MSLSQLVTVNPGDRIQASVWNNEVQNVLTHPIDLISPSTGAINFNLQAHTGLVPSAVSATSGTAGQVLVVTTGATAAWGAASLGGVIKNIQVFTATSTTYTPSAGVSAAKVELWGPGGGGAGSNGATNS